MTFYSEDFFLCTNHSFRTILKIWVFRIRVCLLQNLNQTSFTNHQMNKVKNKKIKIRLNSYCFLPIRYDYKIWFLLWLLLNKNIKQIKKYISIVQKHWVFHTNNTIIL